MMPDVILKYLGHQAIDSAANVCQEHENAGAIIVRGQRAFDGIYLPTNALDAGDELLLFSFLLSHFFVDYILGGYGILR